MATEEEKQEAWCGISAGVLIILGVLFLSAIIGCEESPSRRPVLYVVTSPHCAACLQDYPQVQRIGELGLVTVRIIIAEQNPDWVKDFGVTMLPTYILVQNNHEVWRESRAGVAYRRIRSL